eukprot:TRINITY_DN374_c2_g2_i3.p1 TRINITY_DN374_c2_g2~~TRINITY_DN374_c2_g2_i3.p1  ORF type:complete len:718 (-),score=211.88 TRINITY_DN374_c2_g2_i3:77-1978(-)
MSESETTLTMNEINEIDATIKRIIFDIKAQCFHEGQLITDTLAVFIMKTVVLENSDIFSLDEPMDEEELDNFVSLCVDKLIEQDSPALETIKMQIAFETSSQEQEELREQKKKDFFSKTEKMVHDIVESKAKSVGGLEALFRKIVSFVITQSNLGSTTDTTTVRETTAALESIFPQSELAGFVQLPKSEKEEHLKQFASLVTGIRLFNMEIGQGGNSIEELPKITTDLGKSLSYDLYSKLEGLQDLAAQHSVVINAAERSVQNLEVDLGRHKDELTNTRQYQFYCQLLQTNVEASREQIGIYVENYQQKLVELQSIVKSQTAVATENVFPRFLFLAHMWEGLQEELEILEAIAAISEAVHPFSSSFTSVLTAEQVENAFSVKAETDQRMAEEEAEFANPPKQNEQGDAILLSPDEFDATRVVIEYKGFCAWTIVNREHLLLQGDVGLGVVLYDERYYALASQQAITEFMEHPDAYVNGVIDASRKSPELLALLGLDVDFEGVRRLDEIKLQMSVWQKGGGERKAFSDAQCGTDDYHLPSNIDNDYEWNEWEMRRKALMLVNLRNKKTHSTQTNKSTFRRENETQHYAPKENGTQTGINKGVNHAKKVQYIKGLRGGTEASGKHVKVVNIELEI